MGIWSIPIRWTAAALAVAVLLAVPAPAVADGPLKDWGTEAVGAAEAWELAAPMTPVPVVVAVIDTGVEADHPELREALLPGWTILGGEPAEGVVDDSIDGHGTHVAGVIRRVAGPVPVRVLPIKVLESDGSGSISDLAAGIRFAVDWRGPAGERVGIINLSLGFRLHQVPDELAEAVRYALDSDLVVVAAAGNESRTVSGYYPAALSGVVAVGAAGSDGKAARDSNTGAHVLAPGIEVISALPGGGEGGRTGSSFAAPYVSAGAAILRAFYPAMRRAEVVGVLLATPFRVDSALKRAAQVASPWLKQPGEAQNRSTFNLEGLALPSVTLVIEAMRPGSTQPTEVGRGTADRQGRFRVEVTLPPDESTFRLIAVALRGAERSRPSPAVTVRLDLTPPEPPSDLEAESLWRGRTHFRWRPSLSADLLGYRLLRVGGPAVITRETEFTLDSPRGQLHQFDLTAVDLAGNESKPLRVWVFVPPDRPWFY